MQNRRRKQAMGCGQKLILVLNPKVSGESAAPDALKTNASVLGDIATTKITIEHVAYAKGAIEATGKNAQVGADFGMLLAHSEAKQHLGR
jgi:hypothetical protein